MADGTNTSLTEDEIRGISDRLKAQEEERRAFRQQSWDMTQPPPDQAAEALSLGGKFGVPRQAVEADPDYWRKRDSEAQRSLMQSVSPKTMAWLDNEDNYAVGKDDTENLSALESIAKSGNTAVKFFLGVPDAAKAAAPGWKAQGQGLALSEVNQSGTFLAEMEKYEARRAGRQFEVNVGGMKINALPFLDAVAGERKPSPGIQGRLLGLGQYGPEYDKAIGGYVDKLGEPAESYLRREISKSLAEQKALAPDTGDFAADSLLSGVTSFVNMVPSVIAALATRSPTAAASIMGGQVYGQEYGSGLMEHGLSEAAAKDRALLHSAIELGTERISLGVILDGLGKEGVGIVRKFVVGMATEQAQEQIATLGQDLVDWQTLNPDKTVDEFLAERPERAAQTALATLVASGAMQGTMIAVDESVRRLTRDAVLSQPTAGEKQISDLLAKARKSKIGARAPGKLAEAVESLASGTSIETVTVDLDGMMDALQQAGVDPAATLEALGVSKEQAQKGMDHFGQVQVRISALASAPAMREHHALIEPHVRSNNEEYTPARKEQVRAGLQAEIAREAENIRTALDEGRTLAEREQAVVDKVRERVRGTGMFAERAQENASVAIQSAMVTTLAKRLGVDPVDLFDQHFPRIRGEIDGMVSEEGALESNTGASDSGTPNSIEARGQYGRGLGDFSVTITPEQRSDGSYILTRKIVDEDGERVDFFNKDGSWQAGRPSTVVLDSGIGGITQGPEAFPDISSALEMGRQTGLPEGASVVSGATSAQPSPSDSLSQLIGPKAKSADKAILNTAKKMAKERVKTGKGVFAKTKPKYTRQQIWDETAKLGQPWYQDKNGDWISEIEDGVIVVKNASGPMSEVIEMPSIYAEYPQLEKMRADARDKARVKRETGKEEPGGVGGWYQKTPFLFGAHVRIISRGEQGPYTATHEIQHAVDDIEGREMGRNKPYYLKDTERRAFNTMFRRLMSMEERIARPPWITEDEAIAWWGGLRSMDAPEAQFAPPGTFDPGAKIQRPEAAPSTPAATSDNLPDEVRNADLVAPGEPTRTTYFDEQRQRERISFGRGVDVLETKLAGRTFLSFKDIATSMINNARMRQLVMGEAEVSLAPEEREAFDAALGKEIDLIVAAAKQAEADYFAKKGEFFKAMVGGLIEFEADTILKYLDRLDVPLTRAATDLERIAHTVQSNQLNRTSGVRFDEVAERVENNVRGSNRFGDAVRVFRGEVVEPKKIRRGTNTATAAETKKVREAIEDRLLDLDKPLEEQAPEVADLLRAMIAEEQARPDLQRYGYAQTEPGFFDGMTVNQLLRELGMSRMDENTANYDPAKPGYGILEVVLRLRAAGIVGAKYVPGGVKEDGAPPSQSIVIFDERAPVLLTDQSGNLMQERRGQYAPKSNTVTLFEQADVTTLMHEGAHWYLTMIEEMAGQEGAHPFVVEQYEAIKKWYGSQKKSGTWDHIRARYSIVEQGGRFSVHYRTEDGVSVLNTGLASREEAEAKIEWRETQETFAETFEVFLQTGKAPSPELRDALRGFRDWITKLWQRMYGGGQPERARLSPDIVAVMDRMLAVDEEIDAQVNPIVTNAMEMAKQHLANKVITQRQYDMALEKLTEAREAAKESLMARLMEAKMREDEAWWNTERARVRRDVLREFDKSPVGRALSWLAYGQWKGDVPVGEERPGEFDNELYQAYEIARPDIDLDQFALSSKQREIAQMILDGALYADIEEMLGLTRMQLASYIKEARKKGVPLPKQAPIARSAVSKLESQTDVIIDLFVEGASLAQMGAILNADQSTVGDFVRRLKADGVITDEHIAANEARKVGTKQPQRIQEASVFRERARGYFKEVDLEFVKFRDDRLTQRDSKIVEMARNGASNMDIAEEWGLSVRTVSYVMTEARRLGIDVPYATNAQDAPLIERVLRLEEKGMTSAQIAEIIETSVGNVNDALKRAAEKGLYVPIKDRVIEAWNAGKGVASIAEELRRSPAVVRRYLADAGLIQKQDKSSRYLAPARINKIASYGGASLLGEDSLGQSIRTAARMPLPEVTAWVSANITASESTFPNGDVLTVIKFPLTEDPGAPEVMLSIRLRADGAQSGRADVNLFLDNQMADALEGIEDVAQRGRMAMEMFGKAVLVMRQYAAEYDPRAFSFVAAESQAEGTKAKSREDLYRYMLSSMKMEGYTAYEVESQTSVVNETDGEKSANPMFPSAGFMLVKDGENVEDFARNEILRGNQRGGGAGEVVTVLTAKRLTPDLDASGRRVDRRGSRAVGPDTGGALAQPGDPRGWGETAPPPDLPPMRLDLAKTEQLYGKEAVNALPKAVRDRSRDQSSVDTMLATARAAAKTLKRKPPKTLFQFIRSRKARTEAGKTVPVKQWGIKGAAGELKAMDRPDLINEQTGIHIDYMRELAEEAGYIESQYEDQTTTPRDLLDAIDKESRGEPVYSTYDRAEVQDRENAQEWADWLDGQGVDIFEPDVKKLKAAIAKVVRSTGADLKTPDEAAELLGFETGEQLLAALAQAGSREKFIEAETDRRMRQEFGDPFATGEFAEAARQAAESEVKLMAAEIEIEALSRALGETAASKLAKEMAMDALSVMTVKELAGWTRFLDIERRETRNAMEAVRKGDIAKALVHKRRQLVNGQLAKAAREKSEAIEKTRKDLMSYLTSKGRRDKIDRGYLEKIEALLDQYELRVSKQAPGVQRKRLSAKQYVADMDAQDRGDEVSSEARLLAEMADAKVWRDLTVDEVDYLAGTVKNLAHLGRTKNRLMTAREKRRFDAVIGELVDTLTAAGPLKGAQREYSFRPTAGEQASSFLRTSHAWLMRLEHQFRALDGKANGPLWNALYRIFADAADTESAMMRESAQEVRDAYEMYTSLERYRMHHVSISLPELGKPIGKRWTKMEVISMALNWGVEYNRQALIDGYAERGWTEEKVKAVLDRLMTDKDWDFVERVWKVSGKFKQQAFALEKEMTGVEPKAVEGIDFTTASGRKIQGRYFHIEYDNRLLGAKSRRQAQQDEKEALSDRMKSFTKPQTKNGGLIARVGSGGKPVKLHISVFEKAVADTIHDIAYRRAVNDAGKIIRDPRFADAYERTAGKEAYNQLKPWLDAIVKPPSDQATGGMAALVTVRRNLPIAYMGWKVGTAVIQSTGLLAAVPEVGLRWVAQGLTKATVGSPLSLLSAWQGVAQKSEFMRDRPMGYDRDVREVTTAMGASNPLSYIKRNAFILISAMDIGVSTPIWIGAYDKAMAGKVKGVDAGNEDDAIAYADGVIRRTQTAGRTQDLARVSRDNELWKQVSMLYGYFSGLYGYTSQQVRAVRTGETNPAQFAFFLSIMFVAIPILTELVAGRLLPDDEDDDDDTLEENMGKAVISNFSSMFPVLRDLVNYQLEPQYGYKLSPVASAMGDVAMTVQAPVDGEMTEAEYKRAVRSLGAILGLPSSQIVITGDYLADWMAGEEDPAADPLDAANEALLRNRR